MSLMTTFHMDCNSSEAFPNTGCWEGFLCLCFGWILRSSWVFPILSSCVFEFAESIFWGLKKPGGKGCFVTSSVISLSKYSISFSLCLFCLGFRIFCIWIRKHLFFCEFETILDMKSLLNYALIWICFFFQMWGMVLWNVLDEPLQLQVKWLTI